MSALFDAITSLANAIHHLAEEQGRHAIAVNDQTREQRITNLLVRSQINSDPQAKRELMTRAERAMDGPRRSDRRRSTTLP